MSTNSSQRDRLLALLADEATIGLNEAQAREAQEILRTHRDADPDELALAAAAVDCAVWASSEDDFSELPASLRARISAAIAQRHGDEQGSDAGVGMGELKFSGDLAGVDTRVESPRERLIGRRLDVVGKLGWVAAAACAALAISGWWPRLVNTSPSTSIADLNAGSDRPGRSAIVSRAMLDEFDKVATDVRHVGWTKGTDATASSCDGELIWSPARQEGFMVFRGLKPNDPSREQYQLWIFDPERDERYPVHGGVFDMPKDQQEVIVRIAPKLGVPRASMFVITVEKPGGVWVSDRSRIPVLAKLSS